MSSVGIAQRLKYGFGWGLLGTVGWRLLSAIATIIVARILTPAGFGELGIVRSTANLFMVYAGFRLGITASKHVAQYRESDPERAARILRFTLVMAGVFCALAALALLLFAPFLAVEKLDNEALVFPLRLSSIFLFFQAYSAVRESALVGIENFKAIAIVNMYKGILTFILIVPGAYYWGVTGAVGGLGLASFAAYMILARTVKRSLAKTKIRESVPFEEWRKEIPLLWTFALPGLLASVLIVTMVWVGQVLLASGKDGYIQLGLFEAANQWRTLILFLPGIASMVVLPVLAEAFDRNPEGDFKTAVVLQFSVILVVTLPLTVVAIEFSPLLVMVFGSAFKQAIDIMPVLMGSVFFFALNQSLRKVQDSSDRRWQNFFLYVCWSMVFYIAAIVYIPEYAALGLAYAYFGSELVLFFLQISYVHYKVAQSAFVGIFPLILFSILLVSISVFRDKMESDYELSIHSLLLVIVSFVPLVVLYLKNTYKRFGDYKK